MNQHSNARVHSLPVAASWWAGLVDWQTAEMSGLIDQGRDRYGRIRTVRRARRSRWMRRAAPSVPRPRFPGQAASRRRHVRAGSVYR